MTIADNLAAVQARIEQAARRVKRDPAEITLVGVSKQQPVEAMLAGYEAGLQHFGENRVEEIEAKVPDFLARLGDRPKPTIHMIGHLQRRKVGEVLPYVRLIHSVDTVKLAERIDRLVERDAPPPMAILLECNVSGEASKAGFLLAGWQENKAVLDQFMAEIKALTSLQHIRLEGLMTMAPIVNDPEEARPFFRSLRELQAVCAQTFPQINWQQLSIGMTDDFEIAVEEGATLVRVGRAIFAQD
jgi:pyridoxal phosphate enzyme (YggS family)